MPVGVEWIWARPLALLGLLLPILLLLLARRRREPPVVATGTLSVWRRIEAAAIHERAASRPRPPLSVWLFALALALGALALAGPRLVAPEGPRAWTVLLDHTQASALTWLPAEAGAPGEGPSRYARALDQALAWLAAEAAPEDSVRWIAGDGSERTTRAGDPPGPAWLARVGTGEARAAFPALDRPGTLLVSDRAPSAEPVHAGWFAAGGALVPGPVAGAPEALWVWDGDELTRVPRADAGGALALEESVGSLPAAVRDLAEVWAGVRGVRVVRGGDASARLVVRAVERLEDLQGGLLPAEFGAGRVAWAPGVLAVEGEGELPLAEDPAGLAVALADLFDRAWLPHPDVVPLEARAAAGEASERAPARPPRAPAPSTPWTRAPLDAWLAGLAAFVALIGLAFVR